ncbi:hypothetical protein ACFVFJ_44580 [Streptomyces sp. NPDC057717]|uniref:zinc finger domain-containing protein n=1 Tax=Streptomyces sp. NPDC057717 TaxID=3346224 RepID=UPI003682224F
MIDYEETGKLLALAAARDQRTVGDADVLAWFADLNAANLSYATVVDALTRFYQEMASRKPEDRFRATAVDLIDISRRTRTDRLANFTYEPPAADSDPHYLQRLRGQITATASGHAPAPPNRPAVEPGHHNRMKELLSGISRPVDDEDDDATDDVPTVRRPGPLGVACPNCRAAVGRPCKTPALKERAPRQRAPHSARRAAAKGEATNQTDDVEARRSQYLHQLEQMQESTA